MVSTRPGLIMSEKARRKGMVGGLTRTHFAQCYIDFSYAPLSRDD